MKRISRRELFAAGTGLAGFSFLPAHVLGRGGATPPSEKLNLAFVGIGARGSLNLTELNNPHQNIVAPTLESPATSTSARHSGMIWPRTCQKVYATNAPNVRLRVLAN